MNLCNYCKKPIQPNEKFIIDPYDVESYIDTFLHEDCFKEREQNDITT